MYIDIDFFIIKNFCFEIELLKILLDQTGMWIKKRDIYEFKTQILLNIVLIILFVMQF